MAFRLIRRVLLVPTLSGCTLVDPSRLDGLFQSGTDTASPSDTASPPDTAPPDPDADSDGYPASNDCDDADPERNPGAEETWYDGIDQDCDGQSDFDSDRDGFDIGEQGGADCDDNNAAINPDATEQLDATDHDCDGAFWRQTTLTVSSEAAHLGPPQLTEGARNGQPVVALAWSSEQCEVEGAPVSCLGRRAWDPTQTAGVDAADQVTSLGPSTAGTILDMSYREDDTAMALLRGVRVGGSTTVKRTWLTSTGVDGEPYRLSDEAPLLRDATWVDLRAQVVRFESLRILYSSICTDSNGMMAMQESGPAILLAQHPGWQSVDATACAIGARFSGNVPMFSIATGSRVHTQLLTTLFSDPSFHPLADGELGGEIAAMAATPWRGLPDNDENNASPIDAFAGEGGMGLLFLNDDGILTSVVHPFSAPLVDISITNFQGDGPDATPWTCLVDSNGKGFLAETPTTAGTALDIHEMQLEGSADRCSIASFESDIIIAAFRTDIGVELTEFPRATAR